MERVSICIPTYNGAQYLDECLRSARTQTYPELEILIVDDQSSDQTLAIARRHALEDARIRVEQNAVNQGLVGNWNRCIALATGVWIKFLFQDDLLAPQCVELLIKRARLDGARLLGCARDFIFDDTISPRMRSIYEQSQRSIDNFLAPSQGATAQQYAHRILRKINHNYLGEPTVTLIRKDVFEEFGLFNPDLAQICDLEYWSRVASKIGLAYVPEKLAIFRAHGEGTSAQNRTSKNFRALGVDPMILLAAMLDDPQYEHLRQLWKSDGLYENALNIAWHRSNEMREFVSANRDMPFEGTTAGAFYQEFLQQFPRYRVAAIPHLIWKMRVTPSRLKFSFQQYLASRRGEVIEKSL